MEKSVRMVGPKVSLSKFPGRNRIPRKTNYLHEGQMQLVELYPFWQAHVQRSLRH